MQDGRHAFSQPALETMKQKWVTTVKTCYALDRGARIWSNKLTAVKKIKTKRRKTSAFYGQQALRALLSNPLLV